jgi:hypothetical protein
MEREREQQVSKQNTTEIFPPDILPVRSGVYRTQSCDSETGEPLGEPWGFSYFDSADRLWGCVHDRVDDAWRMPEYEFAHQTKQWYGLNEEPKT